MCRGRRICLHPGIARCEITPCDFLCIEKDPARFAAVGIDCYVAAVVDVITNFLFANIKVNNAVILDNLP